MSLHVQLLYTTYQNINSETYTTWSAWYEI